MDSAKYFETPLWFEAQNKVLSIWEGVCALRVPGSLVLYKLRDGTVFHMDLPQYCNHSITSSGYWMCAELTGTLQNGCEFLYHCQSAVQAEALLPLICLLHNTTLTSIRVRLDPDPLRERKSNWIRRRLFRYRRLGTRLQINDHRLIIDYNMPVS